MSLGGSAAQVYSKTDDDVLTGGGGRFTDNSRAE